MINPGNRSSILLHSKAVIHVTSQRDILSIAFVFQNPYAGFSKDPLHCKTSNLSPENFEYGRTFLYI